MSTVTLKSRTLFTFHLSMHSHLTRFHLTRACLPKLVPSYPLQKTTTMILEIGIRSGPEAKIDKGFTRPHYKTLTIITR